VAPPQPQTREQQLWAAILPADITPSDFRLYVTLLKKANFGTAEIPYQFQPRSLVKLAQLCVLSLATTKRSVAHLERHGWLERHRNVTASGVGGRGHPTTYELLIGRDCDCKGAQREPVASGKQAQDDTVNRLTGERISAGDWPVPAVLGVERERVEREQAFGWPAGSMGEWENSA
jgi:hypothetical protein